MREGGRIAAFIIIEHQGVIAAHHSDQLITLVVVILDAALTGTQTVAVVLHIKGGVAHRHAVENSAIHPREGHSIAVDQRIPVRIIGQGGVVIGGELILPVAVAVGILLLNGFYTLIFLLTLYTEFLNIAGLTV